MTQDKWERNRATIRRYIADELRFYRTVGNVSPEESIRAIYILTEMRRMLRGQFDDYQIEP